MDTDSSSGQFIFEPSAIAPGESALYHEHLKLTDKSRLANFVGYLMPLWYSSISAEHTAVRTAAGIFDCTHMGALEVSGSEAAGFLNVVCTNDIKKLSDGRAQYSYILDAAGNVLDDVIVYRRGPEKFIVVVNAANEAKIKAYLRAVVEAKAVIDTEKPAKKLRYRPAIWDMKDTQAGADCRVDIAVQGPASVEVLAVVAGGEIAERIDSLKSFAFIETVVTGVDCIIARTGYTGAKVGFELFVHPEKASQLWSILLEKGRDFGLVPCGLGARDSLRIEAGLPLYGHELAGAYNISPFEAGYGWAVKLEKGFFIGRTVMAQRAQKYDMHVVRIELPGEKGIRPVRQSDGVLDSAGVCIGWVLSCAKVGEKQFALAYCSRELVREGQPVGIYYIARGSRQVAQGRAEKVEKGQAPAADIDGTVVSRFAKF